MPTKKQKVHKDDAQLCSCSSVWDQSNLIFFLSCPVVKFSTINFYLADGDRDVALALAYIFHFQQEVGNAFIIDDEEFSRWLGLSLEQFEEIAEKMNKLSFLRVSSSVHRPKGHTRYGINVGILERKTHKITEGSLSLTRFFS